MIYGDLVHRSANQRIDCAFPRTSHRWLSTISQDVAQAKGRATTVTAVHTRSMWLSTGGACKTTDPSRTLASTQTKRVGVLSRTTTAAL